MSGSALDGGDGDGWQHQGGQWHHIHAAACSGDIKTIEAELKKGISVNLRSNNSTNSTPLMIAASNHQLAAMKLLVQHKADIELTDRDGDTALHRCWAHAPEHTEFLLDCKADIDKANHEGNTVLI